jgi:hypothetical protein
MIMTETSELTAGKFADRYLAVWSEPDPAARRAAVAALWAPDGVEFIDGGIQFRGHDGLDTRVREAYEQFVATGAYALTSAGDVASHGDIVTFTVQLTTPDGQDLPAPRARRPDPGGLPAHGETARGLSTAAKPAVRSP